MKIRSFLNDQSGSVSIYVSMFVMAILVLMSLSFASIMGNGYTQTAENQLNLQALYAAETGINDARYRLINLIDEYNRGVRGFPPKILGAPVYLTRPISNSRMGESSAISDQKMVIGAPDVNQVYYYELTTGWTYRQTLSGSASSQFGHSLAISRDCLFVGSPDTSEVYAYKYNGTIWAPSSSNPVITETGTTDFGYSLAVSSGIFLTVGSPSTDQVFTYEYDRLECTVDTATVKTLSGPGNSEFGSSIDLNQKDVLAIGAPQDVGGAAYVYKYDAIGSNWVLMKKVVGNTGETGFATTIALNDKNFLAVVVNNASPTAAAVHVYEYKYDISSSTHEWTKEFSKSGAAPGFTDASIDLNDNYVVIGAPNHGPGKIYVYAYQRYEYEKDAHGNYEYDKYKHHKRLSNDTLIGERTTTINEFGYSVSLDEDNTLVVGSPAYNSNSGRVSVINISNDPNFIIRRDESFNELLQAQCKSDDNDTNDPDDLYNYHINDSVKYSCLDIDLSPDFLYYDKIHADRSLDILLRTIKKDSLDYDNMRQLDIEWINTETNVSKDFDTSAHYSPSNPQLPKFSDWNYDAPVLKVQITVMDMGCASNIHGTCEPLSRDLLNDSDKTKVIYLYPATNASLTVSTEADWSTIKDGDILEAECNAETCIFSIKDLPLFAGNLNDSDDEVALFLRINSLYKPAHLSMKGYNYTLGNFVDADGRTNTGERVRFKDVQAVIGATGHANYVRVALEERLRLQPVYDKPEYAIHSATNICKVITGDQDTGTDFESLLIKLPNATPAVDRHDLDCDVY